MAQPCSSTIPRSLIGLVAALLVVASVHAQQPASSTPPARLPGVGAPPDKPLNVLTEDGQRLRVVPLATGLSHPWGLTFLPDGRTILFTERAGRLRMIRDGVLDPTPISGVPVVNNIFIGGLNDVAVHPQFVNNQYVYLSYAKSGERGATLALARGRLRDTGLTDVRDIFVAEAWESAGSSAAGGGGTFGGRMLFGPDGMLYMTVGDRDTRVLGDDSSIRQRAQKLDNHAGKVLRLRDDGTAPPDNPFRGKEGAKPEIYTYGHRNAYGLAFHPDTGALWECEFGPMGGDELNVLRAGLNYGWPLVSVGRNYTGEPVSDQPWWRPGIEMPVYVWNPTFNPTNILFYTGTRFPTWRRSLIASGLGSRQLQRLNVNQSGAIVGRPLSMLAELGVRFRDVRQGPDGLLYVLTEMRSAGNDDSDGAVLRIEPIDRD